MNETLDTSQAVIVPQENNKAAGEAAVEISGSQLEMVFDFSVGTGRILETFAQIGQEL